MPERTSDLHLAGAGNLRGQLRGSPMRHDDPAGPRAERPADVTAGDLGASESSVPPVRGAPPRQDGTPPQGRRAAVLRTGAVLCFVLAAGWQTARNLTAFARHLGASIADTDWVRYRAFAWQAWQDGFEHLYRVDAQQRAAEALGMPPVFFVAIFPPPMALAVIPLLPLGVTGGYLAWVGLGTIAVGSTWWLSAPPGVLGKVAHLLALTSVEVTLLGFIEGQIVLVQFGAVGVAWWLLQRDRQGLAAVALLACALKPQTMFLIPFCLAASGRRRTLWWWLAGAGAITALSLALLGPAGAADYVQRLRMGIDQPAAFVVPTYLSIPIQLRATGLVGPAYAFEAVTVATALLAAYRNRGAGPGIPIAMGVLASLMAAPFLHAQDLMLLFPAAWLLLRERPVAWAWLPLAGGYVALLGIGAHNQPGAAKLLLTCAAMCLVAPALLPRATIFGSIESSSRFATPPRTGLP